MKVLITGGTGFLGSHTARRLKQLGHDVTVLGRNPKAGQRMQAEGVSFCKVDLGNQTGLLEATQNQDAVIHCAALASPFGKYQQFHQANVVGTQNLIKACLKSNIKRIVNISTPSIYFNYQHRLEIREEEPIPKPVTFYAETKLKADETIHSSGIPCISLRPRAIFGPGDRNVLPRMIAAGQNGRFPIVSGGESYVDLSYIDNVVDAIVLSLNADGRAIGRVFNITNGEPMTIKQLASQLFSRLEMPVRFRNVRFGLAYTAASALEKFYSLFRKGQEPPITRYAIGLMSRSQTLSIEKAREFLGYTPKISVADGLDRFVVWWKQAQA